MWLAIGASGGCELLVGTTMGLTGLPISNYCVEGRSSGMSVFGKAAGVMTYFKDSNLLLK